VDVLWHSSGDEVGSGGHEHVRTAYSLVGDAWRKGEDSVSDLPNPLLHLEVMLDSSHAAGPGSDRQGTIGRSMHGWTSKQLAATRWQCGCLVYVECNTQQVVGSRLSAVIEPQQHVGRSGGTRGRC
jgi:hypothetical protein